MDCYFHTAVPSVALCVDCAQTICATCRDSIGLCPSCRLGRRIDAASAARPELRGRRGPSTPPPGRVGAEPPRPAAAPSQATRLAAIPTGTRALLSLGYPFWPLAALALAVPRQDAAIRRQAMQALGFNFGLFGLWIALEGIVHVPVLGLSAWPLLLALFPVWLVASVLFGVGVWNGEDVRVPLVSDYLDGKLALTR